MKLDLVPFENNLLVLPNLESHARATDDFLSENVFLSFLERIYTMFTLEQPDSLCLQSLYGHQSILETFIHVDLTNMTIRVPQKALQYINQVCPGVSMIIIPIKLHLVNVQQSYSAFDNYNINLDNISFSDIDIEQLLTAPPSKALLTAHSNLLLIDNHAKTIEYFEPHGLNLQHTSANIISLNNIVYKIVVKLFPFVSSYTFKNASTSCIVGVQAIQNTIDQNVGHCLAWSLFFLLMRLLNNKLRLQTETVSEFIHRFLVSLPPVQLDDTVKRFITYVQTLPSFSERNYSNYITIEMQQELSPLDNLNIENRLKQIAEVYIKKLINASEQDISILFTELISYRNIPSFHNIMSSCMINVITNESDTLMNIAENQKVLNNMFGQFSDIENEGRRDQNNNARDTSKKG